MGKCEHVIITGRDRPNAYQRIGDNIARTDSNYWEVILWGLRCDGFEFE